MFEDILEYLAGVNWLSYFFYNILIALICVGFYYLMRGKSEKVKYYTILGILIFGFFLHFAKLLLPEYRNELPASIKDITFTTPCAISAMVFPFIYICKNKALKDYFVVFGIISGILTLIFPLNIYGRSMFDIEVIRFYTAHLIIILAPLFTYIFKIHTLSKKWIKHTILLFLLVLLIIVINNELFDILVLKETGEIQQLGQYFK